MGSVKNLFPNLRNTLRGKIKFRRSVEDVRTKAQVYTTRIGVHPERGYQLADLYIRKVEGEDANGKLHTRLLPTGELPTCAEYLSIMGYRLPEEMFSARRRGGA